VGTRSESLATPSTAGPDKDMSDVLHSVSENETDPSPSDRETVRLESLGKLEAGSSLGSRSSEIHKDLPSKKSGKKKRRKSRNVDAVIVLKDEKAPIFQDFLKYAYPQ
jgi:hypothetical protein